MNEVRNAKLQSSIGSMRETEMRSDMDMYGVMMVGKVTRVHHKHGTADIIVIDSGDTFKSSPYNEGQFAARIMQPFSGYHHASKKPYGTIMPIAEGSLVLVTFLNGLKQRPIILGTFPRIDSEENVYPTAYPYLENIPGIHMREAMKTLSVYPSGLYEKTDGEGNHERTFIGGGFLVNYSGETDFENQIDDTPGGYNYEDLTEKDKDTTGTISPDRDSPARDNGKMLFVHPTVIDGVETFIRVYLSDTGELRISRDSGEENLTYIELSPQGDLSMVRQLDSKRINAAQETSEVVLGASGEIKLKSRDSEVHLNENFEINVPGKIIFNGKEMGDDATE